MFRTRYIKTLILAVAAVAAACTADPADPVSPDPDYNAEPVSLTIDFSIADLGIDVETRGGESAGAGSDSGESSDTGGSSESSTPTFELSGALPEGVVKYLNPDKIWTAPETDTPEEKDNYNEARSINGSVMTCLTVILIHRHSNRIVGLRRIPDPSCPCKPSVIDLNNTILVKNEDGSFSPGELLYDENHKVRAMIGTHARVTFDYNNPYHVVTDAMVGDDNNKKKYIGESVERLVRGEYTILAIANYDHNVTTSATDEGAQTLNVDKTLEGISDLFHEPQHMAEGIGNFNRGYKYFYDIRFLMNRTLTSIGNGDYNVVEITGTDGKQIKPYIRPAVHQTLSVAKEFYLEASDNHLDLELLRISSRTRVEVKNNSTTPLKVHSLEFSPNYTQSTIYLFRRDKNDRDYSELASNTENDMYQDHDGKGAPMVGYTGIVNPSGAITHGAIVPFLPDWGSDDDKGVKVEPNAKKCIFDALMYESNVNYKDADDPEDLDSFTYKIKVSYPEVKNYKTTDPEKIDMSGKENVDWHKEPDYERATFDYAIDGGGYIQIPNGATVEDVYKSIKQIEQDYNDGHPCYFLIEGVVNENRFLYEKEDGTLRAATTDITLTTEGIDIKSYLWSLDGLKKDDADGNYYCYLKNIRSEKHMPNIPQDKEVNPADGGTPMKSTDEASQKYKLEVAPNTSEANIAFSNNFPGSQYGTYYLSVWKGETYLSGWHDDDRGCQYRLYPIKLIPATVYVGTPKPIEKTVKLTTFSDETGIVEDVREIQRNDFVRILVEVSYNPDKSDFEFEVNSWKKAAGEVEFD